MTRLSRVTQTIMASNPGSQQVTQFGSTANASTVYTTSAATIQALANWAVGWYDAVISGNAPLIEDMNGVFLVITQQLAYLLGTGIAEWDSGTTYYTGNLATVPVVVFQVTSANATAGATYTNNGFTFTVMSTISTNTLLTCTYTGQPLTSGTLTKATGTGDATITFSAASVSTGTWISIADTNLNNAVTDTAHWMAYVPSFGKPFQHMQVNSTGNGAEYTYRTVNDQVPLANYTVPAGYNLMTGFTTIGSGITWTIAGSMCVGGYLQATGTGVVQATGTGVVHGF